MPRQRSVAVAANPPASGAETVIASIAPNAIPAGLGGDPVDIEGVVDITSGTGVTSVTLKIERGQVAGGTVIATIGPIPLAASTRAAFAIAATDNETNTGYVLTATFAGATGAGVTNSVNLTAVW